MSLESDLLRTFVAVSETGSFTHAAKLVRRTQSAVSLQIKRLEELAGSPLFERGPRGVAPTRLGLELLGNARRVVSLLDEIGVALKGSPLSGLVRIGLPEEYGHAALTRALCAFAARYSNVEVTAQYGRSEENRSRVAAGELDLAVLFDWKNIPGAEVLRYDPTVWATSETHRVDERSPLPIALYASSAWCSEYAIRSLTEREVSFRVAYTSDTNAGLKLAVMSGLAIAPLSRSNIPEGCRELTAADGFGAIDESRLVLQRHPRATGAAVDGMARAMFEAFRANAQ